ncbi:MAG: hypothetical protein ABI408_03280 [Gemmatimonadaceae bacterium]
MAEDVVLSRLIETGTKWPLLGLRIIVFAWGHTIEGTITSSKDYDGELASAIDKAIVSPPAADVADRSALDRARDALKALATEEGAKGREPLIFLKSVSVDGDKNLDRLRIPVSAVVGYSLLEKEKEKIVNDGFLRR